MSAPPIPKTKQLWPTVDVATVLIAWGLLAATGDRTGSKFAYTAGPHIKLAGALTLLAGASELVAVLLRKRPRHPTTAPRVARGAYR